MPIFLAISAKSITLKLQNIPYEKFDYAMLAENLEFFSGADIDGLIDQAKNLALSDMIKSGKERSIMLTDFKAVIDELIPSNTD